MRKGFLALVICWLLTVASVAAQPTPSQIVDQIEEAYIHLEYDAAAQIAQEALLNYQSFTVPQLTKVHTILGLIGYSRGDLAETRRQFLAALQLDPELELDPVLVPPKIQEYFEGVRAEFASAPPGGQGVSSHYVLLRDPRPEAALRSLILPGWGQVYKGQTTRGTAFVVLFGAGLGGAVITHLKRSAAWDRYEAAPAAEEAEAYDAYVDWHRVRTGFLIGTGLVWISSYIDALVSGAEQVERPSVSVNTSPSSVSLRLRF